LKRTHEITLDVCPAAFDVDAGIEITLAVKASCSSDCNLEGRTIKLVSEAGTAEEAHPLKFDGKTNETPEFRIKTPTSVGTFNWRVVFLPDEQNSLGHGETSASFVLKTKAHTTSLAVWDVSSPVIVNHSVTMKIGARCSAGCELSGCEIGVHDETGTRVAGKKLGDTPWEGTAALYWAEASAAAPAGDGSFLWTVRLTQTTLAIPHEEASFRFSFISVRPPEHRVIVSIVEKDTGNPISDVQVRLGPHKAVTDTAGLAQLEVATGVYELNLWNAGFEVHSRSLDVTADTRIQVEMVPAPEPDTPYWMG
jgi:hypothetical protein